MFHTNAVILLVVNLVLTNGQERGIGLGTCTYSFVVQSPYCGKDVGRDAEADIQRLQDSTDKLKTRDVELATETATLKREIDAMKRENNAIRTSISLLQSKSQTSLGEADTARTLRVILIEGQKYIFLGCPNDTVKETVYFMPLAVIPTLTQAISFNETGLISGLHMTMKANVPPFPVYCSTGLFIVIQRRVAPFKLSFNRTWEEYKNGFGDLNGEFWLGLEKLYQITNQPYMNYLLQFEMRSQYANKLTNVEWKNFYIGDESEQYMIKRRREVLGSHTNYEGYYRMSYPNIKFITFDKDDYKRCGLVDNGFWYEHAFPHGPYECGRYILNNNIPKTASDGPQMSTEIKIRPIFD